MKKLIIFIVVTVILLVGIDLYAEYIVNREVDFWIGVLSTLGVAIIILFYIRYCVRYLRQLLNL